MHHINNWNVHIMIVLSDAIYKRNSNIAYGHYLDNRKTSNTPLFVGKAVGTFILKLIFSSKLWAQCLSAYHLTNPSFLRKLQS